MNAPDSSQDELKPLPGDPAPPKGDKPRAWKTLDFWKGVGIFFVLNGILFILSKSISFERSYVGFIALVLNTVLVIYTARKRPNIAAGILFSIALLFVLGLCAGVLLLATCFSFLEMW